MSSLFEIVGEMASPDILREISPQIQRRDSASIIIFQEEVQALAIQAKREVYTCELNLLIVLFNSIYF